MDVGNWEWNALVQELGQSMLACGLGVEKTNKILDENTKFNT